MFPRVPTDRPLHSTPWGVSGGPLRASQAPNDRSGPTATVRSHRRRENRIDLRLLEGGERMGALMRAHDWSDSPPRAPTPVRSPCAASSDCCCSPSFRCSLRGGRSSDPLQRFLRRDPGTKHPRALGRRFHDIWSEICPDISPLIDAAVAGQAPFREDLPRPHEPQGYDEQTWFTFSYSPVRDESGKVAGISRACTETTGRILAERALRELNETLERRVIRRCGTQAARRYR